MSYNQPPKTKLSDRKHQKKSWKAAYQFSQKTEAQTSHSTNTPKTTPKSDGYLEILQDLESDISSLEKKVQSFIRQKNNKVLMSHQAQLTSRLASLDEISTEIQQLTVTLVSEIHHFKQIFIDANQHFLEIRNFYQRLNLNPTSISKPDLPTLRTQKIKTIVIPAILCKDREFIVTTKEIEFLDIRQAKA